MQNAYAEKKMLQQIDFQNQLTIILKMQTMKTVIWKDWRKARRAKLTLLLPPSNYFF